MFEGCSWLPVVCYMKEQGERNSTDAKKKKNQSIQLDWAVNREG